MAGSTGSTNFPTLPGAYRISLGPPDDSFLLKLNAAGNTLLHSTYFGGSVSDYSSGVGVDIYGNVYVSGITESTNLPITPGAPDPGISQREAFVAKLNPTLSSVIYTTYLGGSVYEYSTHLFVDAAGRAYVVGYTASADFPTTPGAYDRTRAGSGGDPYDGFVTRINPTGTAFEYSTYLGGETAADIFMALGGAGSMIRQLQDTKKFASDPYVLENLHILALTADSRIPVKPLSAMLQDESLSVHVRMGAAEVLGKIKNPEAEESLIRALQTIDKEVLTSVARALEECGTQRSVQPLNDAMASNPELEAVFKTVLEAVMKTTRKAVPRLFSK